MSQLSDDRTAWTNDAIATHPLWSALRQTARATLAMMPEEPWAVAALEASLTELAGLFRHHGASDLATWIDNTAKGDQERLPQRVLEMFRRGMGGLTDRALYSGGELDKPATERRDELANQIYERVRAGLR